MKTFQTFLTEEAEADKLTHITHAEDRPLFHGHEGFEHAHGALTQAHEHMKAGGNNSNLTMKYDGSPSVVFGHHPKNNKFFVATKGAFNKEPKINHTHEDIERNHGHAPGLASKLHAALDNLPKVTPKKGVYQGDILHSHGDVEHDKKAGTAKFTPNTITYTAKGEEAKKAAGSKIGVAVHQKYEHAEGADKKSLESMHVTPHPDTENFGEHKDVHLKTANHDTSKIDYPEKDQAEFHKHMNAAKEIHDTHGSKMYSAIHPKHSGEAGHLGTYINSTVRNDEVPNVEGFKKHVKSFYDKKAAGVKTEKAKATHTGEGDSQIAHVEANKEHYSNLLTMHHHLQQAKNTLVKNLNKNTNGLEHHIDDKKTEPEGFVVNHTHNGKEQPTKLVNRSEFAKANLLKVKKWNQPK
jgi:hypothetical protein